MGKEEVFDYYYGTEAEQFSFFRIPRVLIQDFRFKQVSTDAKLLYGLMLDRMSLSMKNGWLDEENRVYIIYTLENIMEDLNCGKDKGVKYGGGQQLSVRIRHLRHSQEKIEQKDGHDHQYHWTDGHKGTVHNAQHSPGYAFFPVYFL